MLCRLYAFPGLVHFSRAVDGIGVSKKSRVPHAHTLIDLSDSPSAATCARSGILSVGIVLCEDVRSRIGVVIVALLKNNQTARSGSLGREPNTCWTASRVLVVS